MIKLDNVDNVDNIKLFIEDNIEEYNLKPSKFSAKELKKESKLQNISKEIRITAYEIGVYLSGKLHDLLSDDVEKNSLDEQLNQLTGTKEKIDASLVLMANDKCLATKDLKQYYIAFIMERIHNIYINNSAFRKKILKNILDGYNEISKNTHLASTKSQLNYITKNLRKSIEKAMFLALANGFTNSRLDINTGTKIANEGDSAQFLFLARAVLAGYTCANVDVRSSRYDAIIDYNGHLLKVQVKGISNDSIYLKDRDRGGAGTDTKEFRNKGKLISSTEVDIYVAVDKQFGICYIIPATDVDEWISEGKYTKQVSSLAEYKENWNNISRVYMELRHRMIEMEFEGCY